MQLRSRVTIRFHGVLAQSNLPGDEPVTDTGPSQFEHLRGLLDVRYALHFGLKSDIA